MKIVTAIVFGLSMIGVTGCGQTQQQAPAAAVPAPPVIATTRQLMLGITAPTSDVIFQLGMQEPASDAEWEKVVASAVSLAESANMLMAPPRVVDGQEWLQYANDLISAARIAAAAAQDKNVDQVIASGGPIYQSCVACHAKYGPSLQHQ